MRLASAADLMAVQNCARAAYAPYVAAMGQPPAPMTADYRDAIDRGQVWVCVAPDLKGFARWFPKGSALQLETVAVRPQDQGRGLGTALIRACEVAARQAGCEAVTLYTNSKMVENLRLYPRLGYLQVGHESVRPSVYE